MPALPSPIDFPQGPFTATATHFAFGMTGQRWNDAAPLVIYKVYGVQDAEGKFIPINGTSADGTVTSPEYATATLEEMDEWLAEPATQQALAQLAALHAWILAGRPGGEEPAFLAP